MNVLHTISNSNRQTFKKDERLCSKKIIEDLFKKNQTSFTHPFKMLWMETELPSPYPVQILITASKRHYKKAVDRNYIKRLVREAYRKNKHELYSVLKASKKQLAIAIICVAKEKLTYAETEKKINILLQQLKKNIREHS